MHSIMKKNNMFLIFSVIFPSNIIFILTQNSSTEYVAKK